MPRTKLMTTMEGGNWSAFQKGIRKRMVDLDYRSFDPIAARMGVSGGALRQWIKDPGKIRMDDLVMLFEVLDMPKESMEWFFNEAVTQLKKEHLAM